MLRGAGLPFRVIPAQVDERGYSGEPAALARTLAEAKALDVSKINPGALVIGADQVLDLEGEILHKAKDEGDAKAKLRKLSGKTHILTSGVCVAQNGAVLWSEVDRAHLTMRLLEEDFLQTYCEAAGDVLTSCVGAYALEGHGSWLFEKTEGDYFTILGMPLLPLLGFLKSFKS